MAKKMRRLQFEGAAPAGAIRVLSDRISSAVLAEEGHTTTVNLARVMSFKDPYYGKVELSKQKFKQMIKNFDANTYGQKIFLDVSHCPSDGAAAEITRLFMSGMKLMADAVFTPFGVSAVKERGFTYLSIDFTEDYTDPETGKEHGVLLFGAGLTIRPRVKRLDPIVLSFDDDETPMLLSLPAKHYLTEETHAMWKELMKKLQEQLKSLKLSEGIVKQYTDQFEKTATTLGDDKDALTAVMDAFVATAKQLSDNNQGNNDSITLDFSSLNVQAAGGLDADAVRKLLAEQKEKDAADALQLTEKREANVKLFTETIEGAEGLSEDIQKQLCEGVEDLITPEMTSAQVKALAENQLKLGNQLAAQTQLANLGYQSPAGTVHITLDESNTAKALQEEITKALRKTSQFATKKLVLSEDVSPFIDLVLSEFDRLNAPAIYREHKQFAAGSTGTSDTNLPIGFQRTVILEALSDLRVLDLVQTLTDFGATATTQIPYETRDMSAVLNNGIVYEGQAIHRADVSQEMDLAYILPMKLAFLISNEVIHFSRASQINWDAYGRNVASNARVMRELIVRRICNEMQRSADAFQAADIANEGIDGQLDGATSLVKTVNYPIVRPHQERDLKGNAVGAAENPITVVLDGTAISEYDGTNEQAGGTYYVVTNYNLGYISFVTELGAAATPPNAAGSDDVSYSYATNVAKFDLDNGAVDLDLHLNGLLRSIGSRKAMMDGDRFVTPDYLLMSPELNNTCTNARNFETQSKKNGTDTTGQGDLETVKSLPAYKTNAPSVDLGDERILIGQRGTLSYTIAKPFVTGEPFEAVDSTGKAIGKKQAYGEEYSAIKVPTPIRNRGTSVLAYSFTGR